MGVGIDHNAIIARWLALVLIGRNRAEARRNEIEIQYQSIVTVKPIERIATRISFAAIAHDFPSRDGVGEKSRCHWK
ncbi:MAG: hypothetical protein ACRYGK_06585 [Janthinobacterium lividum]